MELRPYQKDALAALWKYWQREPNGNPLLVCPTGSGKSLILAEIIRRALAKRPHFRCLVLTHRKELIESNARELQRWAPEIRIGIYSAGLGIKRLAPITYAGIQSLYKKVGSLEAVSLIIIDEAHLLSSRPNSMYQKLISAMQGKNRRLKVCGLTATPYRMDSGSLCGEGELFTGVAYDIAVRRLIDEGYLAPLTSKATAAPVDFSEVRIQNGDYVIGELQGKFDKNELIEEHCRKIVRLGKERKSWLIFCAGVKHSEHVAEELERQGVRATSVHSGLFDMERDRRIAAFVKGEVQAICNCQILTTGFNHPPIDLIALLRPTQSTGLYVQMLGRGMRTSPGKANCLVLDFGENIVRHGPIDTIQVKHKNGKAEAKGAPVKICPGCFSHVLIALRTCPDCGYGFPERSCKLEVKPSEAPILSKVEEWEIVEKRVKVHEKNGRQSLRVLFQGKAPWRQVSEFLCFEHGGWAAHKAGERWRQLGGEAPAPRSVAEGYERAEELGSVARVGVVKDGSFWRIVKMEFREEGAAGSSAEEERELMEMGL